MSERRCADISHAVGEQLAGTAAHVESWLLVELRGTWPRDVSAALADGEPGSEVLRAWLDDTPSSRLLFIRRPRVSPGQRVAFVVRASASEQRARRYAFDDLERLDLEAVGELVDSPLVLVCGHGTRDACCALRGNAVYGALAGRVPADALWISSHQGGHRFAANVLVLPAGIHLARVGAAEAATVVGDACAGKISLEHYRGRTVYAPRVQAAEAAVREAAALDEIGDVTFVGDDGERVELVARDGRRFVVAVEEIDGPIVPASCGAEPEAQRKLRTRIA